MYSPEGDPEFAEVRSVTSAEQCFVRFYNISNRTVDVIWINYGGEFQKYHQLQHEQFFDMNTFVTHPWIAVDSETKDRMLLNGQFKFLARTYPEFVERLREAKRRFLVPRMTMMRVIVTITVPLYSLYFRALLQVRNSLKDETDVDSLEIPGQLKEALKRVVRSRNNNSVVRPFA